MPLTKKDKREADGLIQEIIDLFTNYAPKVTDYHAALAAKTAGVAYEPSDGSPVYFPHDDDAHEGPMSHLQRECKSCFILNVMSKLRALVKDA